MSNQVNQLSDTKIGELTYYKWAYLGAFAALGINPGDGMASELALLTDSPEKLASAISAMRKAPEWSRVHAALDVLRAK